MERRAGEGNQLGLGPGNRSTSGPGYCTGPSDSHGWRPEARAGAGSHSHPHATKLQPENSRAAVSWARNSPREWKRSRPFGKALSLGKVVSFCPCANPSASAVNTSSAVFPVGFRAKLQSYMPAASETPSARQVKARKGQPVGAVGCPGCKYPLCNPSCIHIFVCTQAVLDVFSVGNYM